MRADADTIHESLVAWSPCEMATGCLVQHRSTRRDVRESSGPSAPDRSAGDRTTFRGLFDAHAEALRRYAERIVRSRETAEDVVQEVFLRLWRVWDRVELGAGTRAYLYITTRSRALNQLKRERRESRWRELGREGGIHGDESRLRPEGEATVEAEEIVQAIERVLAMMPPRQREVATLRLRGQLTAAEIAARLGISPRTVGIHLGRATRAMRAQLPPLVAREPYRLAHGGKRRVRGEACSPPDDHAEGIPLRDEVSRGGG